MTMTHESHMPPWGRVTQAEKLELFCGNKDACRIMDILALWTHVYDDLIDGDTVDPKHIHDVFWALLIELPSLPLHREVEHLLRPLYMSGILNWRAANDIEKLGSLEELHIAHATRYSVVDIGFILMLACGGRAHAEQNARLMRLKFQCDTFAHYQSEHVKGEHHG
jgi:hypothetical protein